MRCAQTAERPGETRLPLQRQSGLFSHKCVLQPTSLRTLLSSLFLCSRGPQHVCILQRSPGTCALVLFRRSRGLQHVSHRVALSWPLQDLPCWQPESLHSAHEAPHVKVSGLAADRSHTHLVPVRGGQIRHVCGCCLSPFRSPLFKCVHLWHQPRHACATPSRFFRCHSQGWSHLLLVVAGGGPHTSDCCSTYAATRCIHIYVP